MLYLILTLTFIAIFSSCFLLFFWITKAKNPLMRRIQEIESDSEKEDAKTEKIHRKDRKKELHVQFQKTVANISRFTKQDEKKVSKLRESLIQAGYYQKDHIQVFLGSKIVGGVLFLIVFLYLGLMGNRPFSIVLLLSLLVSGVGYRLPDVILNFKIHKRKHEIARTLPDALDLLVITVEAGLGLNAAILRVSEDLKLNSPSLSQEFMRVNQDLRTGISREEALRNLSRRNKIEDINIFVGALILADRLGTSIADTLRAQADSLRTRIQQKAEEQAAKAGVKMLLPLVLFILPALIIVLMGPGLISVYRTFNF